MKHRDTLKVNGSGRLEIGGCDAVALAARYGTPLYVMDEAHIRSRAKGYASVMRELYGDGMVCYASKALCTRAIYEIVASEGLGADVVSGGELLTALRAGMNPDTLYFHGNNKTRSEIEKALDAGVHALVSDSLYELNLINEIAGERKKTASVLLRLNPGIEAHTHQYMQTARADSKFGFSIAGGAAEEAARLAVSLPNLNFLGLHCHIGSQIFEVKPFELCVDKMTDFIVHLNKRGVEVRELNLGGGYGVTYTAEDKPLLPEEYAGAIIRKLLACIEEKRIRKPRLILEPGRSIVGEAGLTLYTVGAIKEIKDIKTYVSVDGGMFESPRYALYGAKYEAVAAARMNEPLSATVTVAGKCCESGDILIADAKLPEMKSGDLLAILTTGAYHYSMASNYNRNPVPPMVLVGGGQSRYIVSPQTDEDLLSRDVSLFSEVK